MKKAIKWCAPIMAALACVSFVGCKEEEKTTADIIISAVEKLYGAGYTDNMEFGYYKEAEDNGEIGYVATSHPITDDIIEAELFKTEEQAKAYVQEEGGAYDDGEDVFKQNGKWVLEGTTQAVNAFSSGKSSSHEIITVFGKACKLNFAYEVYGEFNPNPYSDGVGVLNEDGDEVWGELYTSVDEAKVAYEEDFVRYNDMIVVRQDKWVIVGDTQTMVNEFIKIVK